MFSCKKLIDSFCIKGRYWSIWYSNLKFIVSSSFLFFKIVIFKSISELRPFWWKTKAYFHKDRLVAFPTSYLGALLSRSGLRKLKKYILVEWTTSNNEMLFFREELSLETLWYSSTNISSAEKAAFFHSKFSTNKLVLEGDHNVVTIATPWTGW